MAGTTVAGRVAGERTAMSLSGSLDAMVADDVVPSANVTSIDDAPLTTCRLVRMSPLWLTITPVPRPAPIPPGPGDAPGAALGGADAPGRPVTWMRTRDGRTWSYTS